MPRILAGANDAFARATGEILWLTLAAGRVALIFTLALRDVELKPQAPSSSATGLGPDGEAAW